MDQKNKISYGDRCKSRQAILEARAVVFKIMFLDQDYSFLNRIVFISETTSTLIREFCIKKLLHLLF